MSSMTNTFEFGRLVIIRRMSRGVAATICTCRRVRLRSSSIRNRFDGSATATVSVSRTRNSGSTRFVSMYSRGRRSTIFGIVEPRLELGIGHAVLGRQALDDLLLGADIEIDEDFAEQLPLAASLLLRQRLLEGLDREIAPVEQQRAESLRGFGGGHGLGRGAWCMVRGA